MTSLYSAETNELVEQPQMEKPHHYNYPAHLTYAEAVVRYETHLATLRKIPCSPEPGFKDGEKYTEGVDYEIKGAGDWKWCYQLKGNIFSAPIVPVKSEDELWREVFRWIPRVFLHSEMEETIVDLKKNFILTKR